MTATSASDPIDPKDLLPLRGIVDGAVVRQVAEPQDIGGAFLISPGAVMDAPAGSAFMIKDEDGSWHLAQFFRPGTMTGPIAYARTTIEDPRTSVKILEKKNKVFGTMLCFALAGLIMPILGVLILIYSPATTSLMDASLAATFAAIAGAMVLWKALPLVQKGVLARIRGGDHAIEYIYSLENTSGAHIPAPSFPAGAPAA